MPAANRPHIAVDSRPLNISPSSAAALDTSAFDVILAPYDTSNAPGLCAGIALGGNLAYRRAVGLASADLPIALTSGTRMAIASTTKHFASLCYLLLCEQGRAGLDDPLSKYLEIHPAIAGVTMRALMGHVSGIRDVADISAVLCGVDGPVHAGDLLEWYRALSDVNDPVGSRWCYNNGGYLLLSAAIERITGEPLETALAELIFRPVGLRDTCLRRFDTQCLANSAALHVPRADGGFTRAARSVEGLGQGGIVSTVDDLLRWAAQFDAPLVGSPETWALLRTPLRLTDGTSTGYGLGLMTSRYRGVATLSHHGGVVGGTSQMIKIPAIGLDVVVLANRHDVSAAAIAYALIDACVPGLDPVPATSGATLPGTGIYRDHASGDILRLQMDAAGLRAKYHGGEIALVADGSGAFVPAPTASHLHCVLRYETESVTFTYFGHEQRFEIERPYNDPEPPAGRYRHAQTATLAEVHARRDRFELSFTGRFGRVCYALNPVARGVWQARRHDDLPWEAEIDFGFDGGFSLTTPRTYRLPFERIGS